MDAYVQHDSPWITLHFSNTEYAGRSGGRPRETIDEITADLLRNCARGEKSRGGEERVQVSEGESYTRYCGSRGVTRTGAEISRPTSESK
jgi:hypothetical protein